MSKANHKPRRSEQISPTAHYTGRVWLEHGLSHPAFATPEGFLAYTALRPMNALSRLRGGPTLEGFLLARHRLIDHLLGQAIESGEIAQVIEVAAGLSPRGWRFAQRYGDRIRYIEADLPDMAARKREVLAKAGVQESAHHRVVAIDALADAGPSSLAAIAAPLDKRHGTAIITEGLLNYFDRAAVLGMWRRFAAALSGFPAGLYLSDLHLARENRGAGARAFARLLSTFVRGRVHIHFANEATAADALRGAGFASAALHNPTRFPAVIGDAAADAGARLVRVIEARTTAPTQAARRRRK